MRVIPLRPARSDSREALMPPEPASLVTSSDLCSLLFGAPVDLPLPAPADLLAATLALCEGARRKSILPLGVVPAELVLVRRGEQALVSYYATDRASDGAIDVRLLARAIALRASLARCVEATRGASFSSSDPTMRELAVRLCDRAGTVAWANEADDPELVSVAGGALECPGAKVPLAFGFEAQIAPSLEGARQASGQAGGASAHSDAHALLFRGQLWAWARGRRMRIVQGPILLAVQRMVAAVRSVLEANEAGRSAHVRLRASGFVVAMRLEQARAGLAPRVRLTFGAADQASVSVPELSVGDATQAILRLASDVLRALVTTDRTQARNLRVTTLRDQVRALRRRARAAPAKATRLVNDDPDRLRASAPPEIPEAPAPGVAPRSLRFGLRWESAIDGLDASSTFLCGDRVIVATPRATLALDRDEGSVIWSHRRAIITSFMAGTDLVQLTAEGLVEICDLADGEPRSATKVAARTHGAPSPVVAGGGNLPPVVVIAEARDRVLGIDLRTGEPRWRTRIAGGPQALARSGRVLLVHGGDGSLCALDATNGELCWCHGGPGERVAYAPAVRGDLVLAASGDRARLVGLDLFSGAERFARALDGAPAAAPFFASDLAIVTIGDARRSILAAVDPEDGRLRWMVQDPGVAQGAACLALDRALVVHSPSGQIGALALETGELGWTRALAHPIADDVPRRLEPVLRNGALFVPSARAHVLRPQDGTSIGGPLPCELVPDWMRVDERGWVYVAEESGLLCALAPAPSLTLVR
ncbi:MAG: PQQ-binding-like beta-propeller repeat protein [Sandaracinaceae bacterium]|nr:PQQ-binding-like beta-propeller repeat protein [Sandaracinaceae bacterium]